MNFITNLDVSGKQVNFKIDNGEHKTFLGGLISIALGIGLIICSIYYGKDVYYKEFPVFYRSQTILDKDPFIDLGMFENGLIFYFNLYGTEDGPRLNMNNKTLIPTINFVDKINDIKLPIQIENCTINAWDVNKNIVLEDWYCFKYNGTLGNRKYSDYPNTMYSDDINDVGYKIMGHELRFKLSLCEEEKKNLTCNPLLSSDKFVFDYRVSSNIINPKNFSNPSSSYIFKYPEIFLSKSSQILKYHYFSVAEVISDFGFIFEDLKKQFFLEKGEERKKIILKDGFQFELKLKISDLYTTYNRTYLKLIDVVSLIGGFMGLIQTPVFYFYQFYAENDYNVTLFNKLFKFNASDYNDFIKEIQLVNFNVDRKNIIMRNKNKGIPGVMITYPNENNERCECDTSSKGRNNSLEALENDKELNKSSTRSTIGSIDKTPFQIKTKVKENIIKISSQDRLCYYNCKYYFFCGRKKEDQQIKGHLMIKAEEIIEKKSDIIELYKLMDQFKLIKKITLNDNQYFMTKHMGLKDLYYEKLTMTIDERIFNKEKKYLLQKDQLNKYLEKHIENNTLTSVDRRLMKQVDQELLEKDHYLI